MIVNFGSENLEPDVGSGFRPFPIFSNTTGSFGLKVGQHISFYITSESIKTTKYLKNLKQKTDSDHAHKQHLNPAAWRRLIKLQ